MIEGSCLCGGVRYRYDGEIGEISLCHCSQCRKAHGSAFAAVSPVAAARFRIVAGESLLRLIYIEKFSTNALPWAFFYYKTPTGWMLNSFAWNDRIQNAF